MELAKGYKGKPTVIIAHTVKGKGISFMENNPSWHHRVPSDEEYHHAQELRLKMTANKKVICDILLEYAETDSALIVLCSDSEALLQ